MQRCQHIRLPSAHVDSVLRTRATWGSRWSVPAEAFSLFSAWKPQPIDGVSTGRDDRGDDFAACIAASRASLYVWLLLSTSAVDGGSTMRPYQSRASPVA
eukprot:6183865-Pleurochrysis_carterae.AAC.1